MEVKLDKRYPLDVDPERAWTILSDLEAVVRCMPGAELTERVSDTAYKGAVRVKVGPAVAQFGGTVDVMEKDTARRTMVLRGKGADKGGSSASMDLAAAIEADPANPAHAVLHGDSTVIVNGKFAQFGGRMMVSVSEMLLAQFVDNFRQAALALPAPPGAATPADAAQPPAAAPKVAREINGLAIVWMLLRNWWLGLFGKHT